MINGVVSDLLSQNNFGWVSAPEMVELAVVGAGLGMIRNNISLVAKVNTFWDTTRWEVFVRPFLDCHSLAYANALAAWSRDDLTPQWANDLPGDLKRPMRNSLRFLAKTNDSFFDPSKRRPLLTQSQSEWWKQVANTSPSRQMIALRHVELDGRLSDQQESLLLEKLQSTNHAILLNAIAAVERMSLHQQPVASEAIVRELRILVDHRNDEVCAKAMCAVARLSTLDEITIEVATSMVESHYKHIVFAGVYALSTLDTVPDHVLPPFDRSFVRMLRDCDYEFVNLFAAAYNRWLSNPRTHLENLLHDHPEYLPIALETLDQVPDQLVQLNRGA